MINMDAPYRDVLGYALKEADVFSLVWRHEFRFSKSADDLEEKLDKFKIDEQITSSWPGTELIEGRATVKKYQVTVKSIEILGEVSDVFSWLSPEYPEDLAFYKKGRVLFGSIAHEREAWFEKI